jgi:hypothetical protein
VYKPLGSFYQVLSAEAYTKHGLNVHGVVFDELHAQPNRQLFDVMTHGSGDARKQPLYFLITTAGNDQHSICYEVHQKAKDVLEGRKVDPTFYPVIYGADEDDDWTDPKVWAKANPSMGITVDIEKIQIACESAKQNPAEENLFRQLLWKDGINAHFLWTCKVSLEGNAMVVLTYHPPLTSLLLYLSSRLSMREINTLFFPTFGYRRITWTKESSATMCLMMFGRNKVFYIPQRET